MLNNNWDEVVERCGVILTNGASVEFKNNHPEPSKHFLITEEDIDSVGLSNIACFWHSHPSNDVNLSLDDYQMFLKYPDHIHRIYSAFDSADYYVRRNLVMRVEK